MEIKMGGNIYDPGYVKIKNRQNVNKERWNDVYKKYALTDWELIEPENLYQYINKTSLNKRKIKKITEFGCGRGIRILSLVLLDNEINREDVSIKCIDISAKAISDAEAVYSQLKEKEIPDIFNELSSRGHLSKEFENLLKEGIPDIKCTIEFVNTDLFMGFAADEKTDLLIDWMCFHEIPVESRAEYIRIAENLCENYFILTVFCSDDCTFPIEEFKPVDGHIQKHMFSCAEIEQYFSNSFIQIPSYRCFYPGNSEKIHSDGMIFPKKTYFMVKQGRKHLA